ncbi:HAD-like domain-containing protein [Aspergillus pseudotamarii]|uniref:HAD-like domain-containing protein n=1 Tax=Aspergillus pseudotamarii TaxID=132259 RepID=A0A5N6T703_ASPPS|nr:HAD-like domain-containing protein [Aspergillus pseudotamarii]KAE8142016.1 HAD-like domain-containing protein [Aspergillus pseudotamarii]
MPQNTHDLDPATMRTLLSTKTWFGFDLDDTLHEFRKASAHASSAVFTAIHEENPTVNIDDLKTSYRDILVSTTAGAFADGRTSTEYRRERFSLLLRAHGLEVSTERLDRLLEVYEVDLRTALTLKPGALQLLQRIKGLGKKVIVITEGPQDAQRWTVEKLGLRPYIDVLVTTNEIGQSKVDGLFPAVLERYGILASDMVYVGDNEKRDVVPARAAGISAVLYDEKGGCCFDDRAALRLDSLAKLANLLG